MAKSNDEKEFEELMRLNREYLKKERRELAELLLDIYFSKLEKKKREKKDKDGSSPMGF